MNLLSWLVPQERQTVINGIRYTIGFSQEDGKTRYRVDLLSIPAISSAIEIKSNDVSQIPMNLFLRTNGGRQRVNNILNYRLSQQPNRYTNAASFWKTVAMQATLGECFISMRGGEFNILPYGSAVRYVTALGEVRYATVLNKTELAQIGRVDPSDVVIKEDYAYNEVLHLWSFQDEYGVPIPMRVRFRHVLGLGSDIYAYTCNVYNRGGVIAGYLSTDQKVPDAQKTSTIQAFKSLFKRSRSQEAGNDMLMAAVDNGWKFNQLNLSPQEMMLLETKNDMQRDFAQIVNVPLWKLGVLSDYKYATAEAAQREYLQSSLNPLLYLIEREINSKCIADFERDYLYAEFNREALIAIDAKTMAEIDDLAIKNGGMSTDEWRERRNLPHAGQDIRQIPVNVTSANYLSANEALKLQSSQLDIQLKQAQLAAFGKPAPVLTVTLASPPTPPPALPSAPTPTDSDSIDTDSIAIDSQAEDSIDIDPGAVTAPAADTPATPDAAAPGTLDETALVELSDPTNYLASLQAMQARYLADVPGDLLKSPETMGAMVRSIVAEVSQLHGVGDHLAAFADKYTDSANKRMADTAAPDPAYEINRAINAANHEAMKAAHGVKVNVRWAGGANDGQVKPITDPWIGSLRHPPITADETNCFLIPAK